MSEPWPRVKLGDVLRRSEETIQIQPDVEYREITVRLWGNGVIERRRVLGAEIASGRRFVARADQFIASRIDARNGALGLVPDALDGAVVTNDFPLFSVAKERLLPEFLGWLSKTREFVELCHRASEGTTNRVRLKEERFLALEIPLPPLAEQRRIVSRVNLLLREIEEAAAIRDGARREHAALFGSLSQDSFSPGDDSPVRLHVRFQTGYAFKSEWFSDEGIRLARNTNVGHGRLDWSDVAFLPGDRVGEFSKFRLVEGDILVSLDRPLISSGVKVARVHSEDLPALLLQRVARAQFLDDKVLPDYFFCWLRSPLFASAIDPGRSNGVPHISHRQIEALSLPVPPIPEQKRIIEKLKKAEVDYWSAVGLHSEVASLLAVLPNLVLNRAFAGQL